jgi:hypothetical protein
MAQPTSDDPKSPIEESVRMMFRQGGYAAAADLLKGHIAQNAADVPAYELLADALRYSGDKPGAAAALSKASEMYAKAGLGIQSIAAQKRAIKLGVEPDFTVIRQLLGQAAAARRVPTPLFDDMSDDEFAEVVELLEARSFEPGAIVVEEGGPGDGMYVVAHGTLEVTIGRGDAQVRLAELQTGDFFGESALLSGKARTATIRAKVPSECLLLSSEAFGVVASKHPRIRQVMQDFNTRRAASTIETLMKKKS